MLTPDLDEQGYNCSMDEEENGARVTVRRKGTVIGEITIGNFDGGPNDPAQIVIRRFDPNELQEIIEIDEPSN